MRDLRAWLRSVRRLVWRLRLRADAVLAMCPVDHSIRCSDGCLGGGLIGQTEIYAASPRESRKPLAGTPNGGMSCRNGSPSCDQAGCWLRIQGPDRPVDPGVGDIAIVAAEWAVGIDVDHLL